MAHDVIGNYIPGDISCSDEAIEIFSTPPVNYYYDNVEMQEVYPQIPLTPTTPNFTFIVSPSEDFISLENIVLETKVKIELSDGEKLPRLNRTGVITTPAQSLTYSSQTPSLITTSSITSKPSSGFEFLNRKRKRDGDDDDNDDDDERRRKKIKRQQQRQQYRQQQRQQQEASSQNELRRKRKRESDDDNDEERERKRRRMIEGEERKRKKKKNEMRCDSRRDYFTPHAPPPWNRYHGLPQPGPQPNPAPEIFLGCGFEQVPHYTMFRDVSIVLNNEELAPMNSCYGKIFVIFD